MTNAKPNPRMSEVQAALNKANKTIADAIREATDEFTVTTGIAVRGVEVATVTHFSERRAAGFILGSVHIRPVLE